MIIAVDLILVVVLLTACFDGYRKGLVRSLLGLAGILIALVVASLFFGVCGTWVNDTFAEQAVTEIISSNMHKAVESAPQAGETLFEVVDRYVFNASVQTGEYVDRIESEGGNAIDSISVELARAISIPLCNSLSFLALFLLTLIAVRIASFVLDKVFKLPVLKRANQTLGLLFGGIRGILLVMVLSRVFLCILPWLSETFSAAFSADFVERTVVLNFFHSFNFFKALLSGIAML